MFSEFIWLPQFKTSLTEMQWELLTRSTTELLCTPSTTRDDMPGRVEYQRPCVVVMLDDEMKFNQFIRTVFTVIGRPCFKFNMVNLTESFVKLRTHFSMRAN